MTEADDRSIQLYSPPHRPGTEGVENSSYREVQVWAKRMALLLEPTSAEYIDESDERDLVRLFAASTDESAISAIAEVAGEKLRKRLQTKNIQQIAFDRLLPLWIWDGLKVGALEGQLLEYSRNNPKAERQEVRARAEVFVQVVQATAGTEGTPDTRAHPSWARDGAVAAAVIERESSHLAAQSLGPREPLSVLGPVCALLRSQLDAIAGLEKQV